MPAPWDSVDWDADPDWEIHTAGDDTARAAARPLRRESCERSRAVVAAAASLDDRVGRGVRREPGEHFTLRWILVHLIEETARHNGHVDLLREAIDGVTGE